MLQEILPTALAILVISGCVGTPQPNSNVVQDRKGPNVLERWKKAVIHLESATDSEDFYDRRKRDDQLREQLQRGQITQEEFSNQISGPGSGPGRDVRYHGTSLFIRHKDKRYLVTARHVVFDEASAKREFQEEEKRASSRPEAMRPSLLQHANEVALQRIFGIIFRVPSLDEIISRPVKPNPEFLMNLGAGGPMAYTFSPPQLDLAWIIHEHAEPNGRKHG